MNHSTCWVPAKGRIHPTSGRVIDSTPDGQHNSQGVRFVAHATVIGMTQPPDWTVEALGKGVFLFRWNLGFYVSPFVVGRSGVTAFDPISETAAAEYRKAIATVTDLPVTRLVYSHDHRDHIVGGRALVGDRDCEVAAHEQTLRRVTRRNDLDVLRPTNIIGDGAVLSEGPTSIEVRDVGPNHSDSNLLFLLPTDAGRLLVWVDGVEPGVAPYRNLPDTDFAGYLHSLDVAAAFTVDTVLGGHTGPGDRQWIIDYREYLLRLLDATKQAYESSGGQTPREGEDGVEMTERVRSEVTAAAAAKVAPKFGHWRGFRQWAPQTSDRILSFLITGN